MKHVLLFFTLCMPSGIVLGQSATEFTHTVEYKEVGPAPAKDFWVAIPKIYDTGDSGKYAEIYIASASATTVHIRGSRFAPVDKKIKPLEQFIFKVETQVTLKSMEMTTSGVKENKGIHVWSDGADLSVYLYIRNAVSGGGTMILPTSSWGKEYVVASFDASEKYGNKPGEFTIVAAEDSTQVTIVAPISLRTSTTQIYGANTPFLVSLSHGQTIQFISVYGDDEDITGTVITASKPIGVTSAVQCVLVSYELVSDCDFICEMMPPVCSWGKKYITADNGPSGEGSWYSVIASQDNQQVYYSGEEVMLNKYEPSFIRRYGSVLWQSESPFLLTYYPVESFFSSGKHPAMVCMSPMESYAKEVLFQIPADTTRNRVDVVFPVNARTSTRVDGIRIDSASNMIGHLPGYEMRSVWLGKGVHRIVSDSGLSYYAHGWDKINTFAWGSTLSPLCPNREDTLPPVASIVGDCNKTTVTFTDIQQKASKIMGYVIDSLDNLRLEIDPAFVSGDLHDTFYYTLRLNDLSKPGKARIFVLDMAGNTTTVTSRIDARPNPKVTPTAIQIPYAGAIPNYRAFDLKNITITPMTLAGSAGLRFAHGGQGFALVSPDLSELPISAERKFLVSYIAADDVIRRDTIIYGDECTFVRLPLESKTIDTIVGTTGVDLGCLSIGTSREDVVIVDNHGLYELTLLNVTFDDAIHFVALSPALPYVISPEKRAAITVRYTPDAPDTNCTIVHITTKELGELTAIACGCGLSQGSVKTDASQNKEALLEALRNGKEFAWMAPIPNPADRASSIRFVFGLLKPARVTLELFDLEGRQIDRIGPTAFISGIHEELLSGRTLSAGSYMYQYTVNEVHYSGKLTIR